MPPTRINSVKRPLFATKPTLFLMAKNIMDNGKIIRWMDMEGLNGLMVEYMKENIRMEKKKHD